MTGQRMVKDILGACIKDLCIYLFKKNDQNLIEENIYDIAFISCLGTAVGIIDLK